MHRSATLEIELTRRNIPFVKFGGPRFLEAAHIKDVLAILRWAENMRDRVAGFRTVQLLPALVPARPQNCWTHEGAFAPWRQIVIKRLRSAISNTSRVQTGRSPLSMAR